MEQWLPEISEADAIDGDRLISSSILADAWLAARSYEGVFLTGVTELVCWGYSVTDRRRKNWDEFYFFEGKVDAESINVARKG